MLLFRLLQVLGAYGFRGYIEHKKYFLDSIPPAINNLKILLNNGFGGILCSESKADYPKTKAGALIKRMI